MGGRDEEFAKRLAQRKKAIGGDGAVDLSGVGKAPPDPRMMPVTLEEVTFRNCRHEWRRELLQGADGGYELVAFTLVILDPARARVYSYGVPIAEIDSWIEALTALKDFDPAEMLPQSETFGGEEEPSGDQA